jgi:hypothetical protein
MRLAAFLLVVVLGACAAPATGEQSREGKRERRILQQLDDEYGHFANAGGFIFVKHAEGYDLDAVGIPVDGQAEGYTWVLGTTHDHQVRMLDNGFFWFSRRDLERVRKNVRLDPAVLAELQKHVVDRP